MRTTLFTCISAFFAFGYSEAAQLSPQASQLSRRTGDAKTVLTSLGVDTTKYAPIEGDATRTCEIFGLLFPKNETFTTQSPYYTPLYEVPWSQTCWQKPACVVTPNSPQELSVIVLILTTLKTKFAIRGAGHKPSPGFNSIGSDGVLIALQNLNCLSISADKKTVTVGSGNRWSNVYDYLRPYKRQAIGGREPMVGVPGFLLGGGVSLFVNSWGLAIDNVARFEVVLMDGSIVNATRQERSDLYKALKGGMSNFGIVTEFELITKPSKPVYYSGYQYSAQDTPAFLGAYGDYLADTRTDPKSSIQIAVTPAGTTAFIAYDKAVATPKDFARFASIPKQKTLIPPTNGTLDPVFALGSKATTLGSWVGWSYTHKVTNGDFMKQTWALVAQASANLPKSMFLTYTPQGILPSIQNVTSTRGGNVLGVEPCPQIWVDLFMTYTYTNQTAQATKIVTDLLTSISTQARAANLELPYIFASTASNDQKPLRGAGDANFQFVKQTALKYDPQGFMQSLQGDGYLVSKE